MAGTDRGYSIFPTTWRSRVLLAVAFVGGVGFVAGQIFAVLLFTTRSDIGAPRIGDHWHTPYSIFVGDELQPRIQQVITQQGIHTHGDGVIHIHPHTSVAEGGGARLEHFFGDQGGKLTNNELQIPGRKETYKNGDTVEGDDRPSELRILRADSGIHPLC